MKVLVACEESQEVCTAFRRRGHEAYSCDIQPCALYNHIEWHIVEDARNVLDGNCAFRTVDAAEHFIRGGWDLIIAHPPCTYLSNAGSIHLWDKQHRCKDFDRLRKGIDARGFFFQCLNARCAKICVENPKPMRFWNMPEKTQIIEPYMFGEPWKKMTFLWLKGLPPLQPTDIVEPLGLWVGSSSLRKKSKYHLTSIRDQKKRSKTFHGIAEAMAEQWGGWEHEPISREAAEPRD